VKNSIKSQIAIATQASQVLKENKKTKQNVQAGELNWN